MSKKKATHIGSCQCCGSVQKLPGGVLSQHGYRVLWSSFHGVCSGSGKLPYEQSCELIKGFVASATDHMNKLIAFRAELLAPATSNKAWIHEYINGGWTTKSYYQWREIELITVAGDPNVYFENSNGKTVSTSRNGYYGHDVFEVATKMNQSKAHNVTIEIKHLQDYIDWQNRRIAEWELTELQPIKTDA